MTAVHRGCLVFASVAQQPELQSLVSNGLLTVCNRHNAFQISFLLLVGYRVTTTPTNLSEVRQLFIYVYSELTVEQRQSWSWCPIVHSGSLNLVGAFYVLPYFQKLGTLY